MKEDKVKNLIIKLKALASDNSNINEAAAAAAKMQELIEQYNINVSEFELKEKNDVYETLLYENKGVNVTSWKVVLMNNISILNNTRAFYTRGVSKKIDDKKFTIPAKVYIVGNEENIAITSYLCKYLIEEIESLCKKSVKEGFGKGKKYCNSFKIGAVAAITLRLENKQKEMRKDVQSTALVKVNNDRSELEEFMKRYSFREKKKLSSAKDRDGYFAGVKAAHKINLNPSGQLGE